MALVVTKSIGIGGAAAGRDFSTLQAWADACPTDLVAAGQIWKGECYNDGEFKQHLEIKGITTDADHYLILTAAPGHSFVDHPHVRTAPLRYDPSLGVAIFPNTQFAALGIEVGTGKNRIKVSRLQFCSLASHKPTHGAGIFSEFDQCIFARQDGRIYGGPYSDSIYRNCIFYGANAGGGSSFNNRNKFYHCTFVCIPGALSPGEALALGSHSSANEVYNCAFLGPFTGLVTAFPATRLAQFKYCVASLPNPGLDPSVTEGTQWEVNAADQIMSLANAITADFRPRLGSLLDGAASADYALLTDILGLPRRSAPTIGAVERTREVVRSIGNSAERDYTTLQSWADACPDDLVTSDVIWRGELFNDGEIVNQTLNITGITSDRDHYIELTVATGHSFADHPDVRSMELRYAPTKGAGIRVTGSFFTAVQSQVPYTRFSRFQVRTAGLSSTPMRGSPDGIGENLILEGLDSVGCFTLSERETLRNCVGVSALASGTVGAFRVGYGSTASFAKAYNCTAIYLGAAETRCVFDINTHSTGFEAYNCAIFGFNTLATEASRVAKFVHSVTDVADTGGIADTTGTLFGKNMVDQFMNVSSLAGLDLRVKKGADLIGAASSAYAPLNDIGGTSRRSAHTAGAWQYIETQELLRPYVLLPEKWKRQPTYAVELDPNNPLTYKLLVVHSGTRGGVSGMGGYGIVYPGYTSNTGPVKHGVPNSTIFILQYITVPPEWNSNAALWRDTDAPWPNDLGLVIESIHVYGEVNVVARDTGGGVRRSTIDVYDGNLPNGIYFSLTAIIEPDKLVKAYNHRGRFVGTDTSLQAYNFNPPSMGAGYFVGPSSTTDNGARTLLVLRWGRALSDGEVRDLHENPWQVFRPMQRRIYSLPNYVAAWLPVPGLGR